MVEQCGGGFAGEVLPHPVDIQSGFLHRHSAGLINEPKTTERNNFVTDLEYN